MVYIVIPVFNRYHYTRECLLSLFSQSYNHFKIVVVDHGSTDRTKELIKKEFPNVVLLEGDDKMWWAAATNVGVDYALENKADFILTLNNDLIVKEDYLSSLISSAGIHSKSVLGSVSVDINNSDRVAFAGIKWNQWLAKYSSAIPLPSSYNKVKENYKLIDTDLLPGRGSLFPSSVFKELGLFNEKRFPHYMADEELSLRARRAGYQLYINAKSVVYSYIDDTALNTVHKNKKSFRYLLDNFVLLKSPNNLRIRWHWAQNTKWPYLYFVLDTSRVIASYIINCFK
ncbi:glycosyltransferase family 2 protein [Spirosoma soli]|uniref:Glycosyltransferase family 2 protein n=1 Tax=Spirosoma soli TaxID=1770529 RepID=A0ABW5M150_9BACT